MEFGGVHFFGKGRIAFWPEVSWSFPHKSWQLVNKIQIGQWCYLYPYLSYVVLLQREGELTICHLFWTDWCNDSVKFFSVSRHCFGCLELTLQFLVSLVGHYMFRHSCLAQIGEFRRECCPQNCTMLGFLWHFCIAVGFSCTFRATEWHRFVCKVLQRPHTGKEVI